MSAEREALRLKMHEMLKEKAPYEEILKVSQELDILVNQDQQKIFEKYKKRKKVV